MDTKLKNSRRIRIGLSVLAIFAVTLISLCFFPVIGKNAEKEFEKNKTRAGVDEYFMKELVKGSYVLFYEAEGYDGANAEGVETAIERWAEEFEPYRSKVDYYAGAGKENYKNTSRNLELLLEENPGDAKKLQELKDYYQCYFTVEYDGEGKLSIDSVWSREGLEDEIVKSLLKGERNSNFAEIEAEYTDSETEASGYVPKNFRLVYGIPESTGIVDADYWMDEYWRRQHFYYTSGNALLYPCTLAVLALVMVVLNSNRIFKGTIDFKRKGRWYMMEPAILGIIFVSTMGYGFVGLNMQYVEVVGTNSLFHARFGDAYGQMLGVLSVGIELLLIYAVWYLSLYFVRPVFTLGPREYIRQYSLVYLFMVKGRFWVKRRFERLREEIAHVDFSSKTIRLIRRIVILNFLVLSLLSFLWFFGIIALAIYSVALFFVLKRQYDRMEQDYQSLMRSTSRIAAGELDYEDTSDWGIFEAFKQELSKIRSGFSKAVAEEVKSQRMKTELITNVSHDLKTPLTAITTYVELLKDENLTPEQRKAYVEILDKKSRRLKILVEDLFEVSKATSENIKLDLMEVDVVNLLKQVWAEHEARFSEMGLTVKWSLPEEKVTRMLDNQKTWRIFENLFGNIEKYAMPNSRVYVEVKKAAEDSGVEITIKNMSAQELFVSGEELTQRFARGDSSRSTEGSGLGLAIAKSFTQAQKGQFEVTVDGDLFKVSICWR